MIAARSPRHGSANLEIVIATTVCLTVAASSYAIVREAVSAFLTAQHAVVSSLGL